MSAKIAIRCAVEKAVRKVVLKRASRGVSKRAQSRVVSHGLRRWVAIAALVCLSDGVFPATAHADIDVQNIEFFKGLNRFSGEVTAQSGYFVELCLVASDVTSAEVTPPGQPACPMDDFVIVGEEYCCERRFDSLSELDTAFPTGPGQDYTVDITGVGDPDSAVVEFDVATPLAFTDITSPVPGSEIDSDLDLTVTWTLTALPSCTDMSIPPTLCAEGIAMFVSPTMGMDDDVYSSENDPILITETSRDVPNEVLQPNTQYRIEVETFEGMQDVAMITNLEDSYLLSRFYEDINSIVVPEPETTWSQAVVLALLFIAGKTRRRG